MSRRTKNIYGWLSLLHTLFYTSLANEIYQSGLAFHYRSKLDQMTLSISKGHLKQQTCVHTNQTKLNIFNQKYFVPSSLFQYNSYPLVYSIRLCITYTTIYVPKILEGNIHTRSKESNMLIKNNTKHVFSSFHYHNPT